MMRMNREGCLFYVEGKTKTKKAKKQPETQKTRVDRSDAGSLASLQHATDVEEAAVQAIMRAPLTAREVTSAYVSVTTATTSNTLTSVDENTESFSESESDDDAPPILVASSGTPDAVSPGTLEVVEEVLSDMGILETMDDK